MKTWVISLTALAVSLNSIAQDVGRLPNRSEGKVQKIKVSPKKKTHLPRTYETEGDTFVSLQSKVFYSKTNSNNSFGSITGSQNRDVELRVSERWDDWIKPYLFFGQHVFILEFHNGNYQNTFFYSGLGAEFNPAPRVRLNFSMEFGNSLLFDEVQSYPVGDIESTAKINVDGSYSFVYTPKVDWSVGAGTFIASPVSKKGASTGVGFLAQSQVDYLIGNNLTLQGGLFSRVFTIKMAGVSQNTKDLGVVFNLRWRIPAKHLEPLK